MEEKMEIESGEVTKPEESGRGTDSVMAHMSLGEIVIPRAVQDDPEVQAMLQAIFEKAGADINEFTVGHEANKINPETGYPEFGFFKSLKKIASVALPIAASFIPGVGPLAAAGLGAAGGVLGGGGLKGALLGGALSGIGAGLSGGATSALKGTALGSLENSISGALSPIGSAIKGGFSSLGEGLGDIYSSASGALSNATGGIGDQIGSAYNGSVLQDAFKSGGDVLKSAGFGTSNDSLANGVGASAGGGASSYNVANTDTLSNSLPWLNNTTNAVNTGATEVAKSSNYASPIASALLGSYTNNKAEDQLLKQQAANRDLYAPYQNFSFTPGDLTQDPGFKFNLEQGNQALDRAQLARGGWFSGNALKEAQTFGQGLADNTYNSAFNRALQTQGAGLQGANAMAGVNDNIGNIRAGSTVNTGNLYSGALGSILGGNSFTNAGALQGGSGDFLSNYLRQLQMQRLAGGMA